MRKCINLTILRSIYFTVFDSYLSYCCLAWAQNCRTIQQIVILQKKAIEIIKIEIILSDIGEYSSLFFIAVVVVIFISTFIL